MWTKLVEPEKNQAKMKPNPFEYAAPLAMLMGIS